MVISAQARIQEILDAPGYLPGQAYQVRHDGAGIHHCHINI